MEESEKNMSAEDVRKTDSPTAIKKPKKRSLVERELETNMTSRVTSPTVLADGLSTSRYGRARRLKTEMEHIESQKIGLVSVKSTGSENSPVKVTSPVYRMHASNSPRKAETPKKAVETYLDSQIDNIYQENISLSRFSDDSGTPSPAKKFPKVYIRKDLIQKREADESLMLIKNLFSPINSATKSSSRPLRSSFEHSSEKYNFQQNGHVGNASVVKTLDFDGNKKIKKENKDQKQVLSKSVLFDLEAKCPYQVGDLAWARMGTFPFWPCIITREPYSEMFVKKKLFGRIEHDIIHVTFFGDNGRRSWIMDNMLRKYSGQLEFEATREKFTLEDKKKDPRLYAAFFISDKKQTLWNISVEEAESLLREPKRLRVDIFNDMLWKLRASKKGQKSSKITRTNSDVSLSESLYDSLFSEDDTKTDDAERSKNRSNNKSFDVSDVVTACLDNITAKTGITKIQKQSHMDRWLQKAKSKTPEKSQSKSLEKIQIKKPEKIQVNQPKVIQVKQPEIIQVQQTENTPKTKPLEKKTGRHLEKTPTKQLEKLSAEQSLFNQQIKTRAKHSQKMQVKELEQNQLKNSEISLDNPPVSSKGESSEPSYAKSPRHVIKLNRKVKVSMNSSYPPCVPPQKPYRLRTSRDCQSKLKSSIVESPDVTVISGLGIIAKVESLAGNENNLDTSAVIIDGDNSNKVIQQNRELNLDSASEPFHAKDKQYDNVQNTKYHTKAVIVVDGENTAVHSNSKQVYKEDSIPSFATCDSEVSEFSKPKKDIFMDCDDNSVSSDNKIELYAKESESNKTSQDSLMEVEELNTNKCKKPVEENDDKSESEESSQSSCTKNNESSKIILVESITHKKPLDSIIELVQDSKNLDKQQETHKSNLKYQMVDIEVNEKLMKDFKAVEEKLELHRNTQEQQQLQVSTTGLNIIENVEIKSKNSESCVVRQNVIMRVDKDIEAADRLPDVDDVQSYKLNKKTVAEVNVDNSINSQMNEMGSSSKFETVSNQSVDVNKVELTDDNCNIRSDTGLNEAHNVITIEASVTETKNDDITNNQAEGGMLESNEGLIFLENAININILDKMSANFIETNHVKMISNKSSTPKKIRNYDEYESNLEMTNFNKSPTYLEKEVSLDSTQNNHSHPKETPNFLDKINNENSILIDTRTDDGDLTEYSDNDILNESGNSESIFQLNSQEYNLENNDCETYLETSGHKSLNESTQSESILENSHSPVIANKNDDDVELPNERNDRSNLGSVSEDHDSSTRPYIESPTFTQLLESEEFFREVNEPLNIKHNNEFKEVKNVTENLKLTNEGLVKSHNISDAENVILSVTTSHSVDEAPEGEDTSEDEPSPEYESLDEDIAEDFRKHMKSIESNITDKKDEEQIVKICNEIAEKAKLSPTKYTLVAEEAKDKDKLDTGVNSYKECKRFDHAFSEESHTKSIDENTISNNKIQQTLQDVIIEKREPRDETLTTVIEKSCDMKSQITPEFHVVDNFKSKDSCSKFNGEVNIENICDTTVLKSSTTSNIIPILNKLNCDNSALKLNGKAAVKDISVKPNSKSQKILEIDSCHVNKKDEDDCVFKVNGDATTKEISKTKRIYRTRWSINSLSKERFSPDIRQELSEIDQLRKSCEFEPKVLIIPLEKDRINFTKIAKNDDEKSKNKSKLRLSLKKDITAKNLPKVEIQDTKNDVQTTIPKKEVVTLSKEPTRINIADCLTETKIPEKLNVNGYCNPISRNNANTPDLLEDTDFDIDTISLNSEDSDISLANSVSSIPKRNLRSRPEKTLENALKNPEFLKYLELRQDFLLDEHPELNEDEIVTYVHKTWQYEEDLKSDLKKSDDAHHSNLVKGTKQETPSQKKSKKLQPKDNIENYLREKYEKCRKTFDLSSETTSAVAGASDVSIKHEQQSKSPVNLGIESCKHKIEQVPEHSNDELLVKDKDLNIVSVKSEEIVTPKRSLRSNAVTPKSLEKQINDVEMKSTPEGSVKKEKEFDSESVDSTDSEVPLRKLRSKALKKELISEPQIQLTQEKNPQINVVNKMNESMVGIDVKDEIDETASVSDNEPLMRQKKKKTDNPSKDDPEFIKYLELRQDALMDENPQLTQDEIVSYMYKTWIYEESSKSDMKKNDELEQATLVKGLNNNDPAPPKKARRKPKVEKQNELDISPKEKPRRRTVQPYYNENYSDIEDEIEIFEIFKTKKKPITVVSKVDAEKEKSRSPKDTTKLGKEVESPKVKPKTEDGIEIIELEDVKEELEEVTENYVDAIELYFTELTKPKPNVFKGLIREKICEICELAGNLIKCKRCNGTFHADCVKKEADALDKEYSLPPRGRKKKKGRKHRSFEDSESQSDEKSQNVSADNLSIEKIVPPEICIVDADTFESQLSAKMMELIDISETNYDSYSSDDGIDWKDTVAGKCEIVEVKLKRRIPPIDYSNFKCNNCHIYDKPICFVCKFAVSKTNVEKRQKCHVAHCHKYYHLTCLDHWPQTQFNSGEPSKNNKKINEFFEALTCPRHVCHTCVSDDPRGCKTRFSGDKLAKCVRCPATYHSFNKCLPAGTQILTASHIICPRHLDQIPGKVPCHVNTGWCFICAQGGSLICCEYCPTSFHAECLNIKPPEGNYMCEDCETGRLPLYGEMVWVKLGHYRWWPAMILHPSEIPDNIMAAKHSPGEFVVRFFGQYDHYWVNRGRVFPYQEGDSGRVSANKTKIDAAFTMAIEHAQRAYEILKNAEPNEEESLDIASSLLPPHYVKLKCNKPCGSLYGKKMEDPSLSLTQCECNPDEPEPCGPYSQCLNRMLLTECGPTCLAGERCNNRAFEKRLYPKLVPYRTPHRGWGLKTLEDIKGGQFVIEYVGELIDEEEFRRRMRRKHEIRDENFYFLTLDKERMIDAGPKGNLARFMNHCCEPNCETQKWTVLGDVRVGLFAIDDIPANSEVTFNYNLECAGIEKKRCMCGAKRCSGYIGAKPKQDDSQSKKEKTGRTAAKRTYKKRKVDVSPATSKKKAKRPIGRPRKPKELTEIEKDLLIIKSAASVISSDESSGTQSMDDKRSSSGLSIEDRKPRRQSLEDKKPSIRLSIEERKPSVGNSVKDEKLDRPSVEDNISSIGSVEDQKPVIQIIVDKYQSVEDKKSSRGHIVEDKKSSRGLCIEDKKSSRKQSVGDKKSRRQSGGDKSPRTQVDNKKSSRPSIEDKRSYRRSTEDKNPRTLKRKRVSITTEEVSLCNGYEPSVKKQKCDLKSIEVGD